MREARAKERQGPAAADRPARTHGPPSVAAAANLGERRTIERGKRAVQCLLVRSGAAEAVRRLRGVHAAVLAYHNVVPDGHRMFGDASLHIPRSLFARHLDTLIRSCDVVPLEEVLAGVAENGRPRVAITFDDAYTGACSLGVAELRRRGLPATFFVSPGLLGRPIFWWDLLADPAAGRVPAHVRRRALEEMTGDTDTILSCRASENRVTGTLPLCARPADESTLLAALSEPGMGVASHGWSHRNLVRCRGPALDAELRQPLAWLRDRVANVLPYIAYPYGLADARVEMAAARAGYRAGFTVDGRRIPRKGVSLLRIPRVNVPAGCTPEGLLLRIAGLGRRA